MIETFLNSLPENKKSILEKKHGESYTAKVSDFVSRITVYIADNNVLKTSESPDYEAIRLISDIGGQLGLWIGISVMTLFEVLQLVADVFRFITAGSGAPKLRLNQTYKPSSRTQRVDRVADQTQAEHQAQSRNMLACQDDWRYEVDKLTAV